MTRAAFVKTAKTWAVIFLLGVLAGIVLAPGRAPGRPKKDETVERIKRLEAESRKADKAHDAWLKELERDLEEAEKAAR